MHTMSMENMYTQVNIKLDALHDLVMTMKHDMDRRFEEVDRRFEELGEFKKEVQQNFARLEAKMDTGTARLESKIDTLEAKMDTNIARLEAKIDKNTEMLEAKIDKNTELVSELYKRGDKLELSFSRKVLLGNSALAGIVAFFVALFTGRMIIEN